MKILTCAILLLAFAQQTFAADKSVMCVQDDSMTTLDRNEVGQIIATTPRGSYLIVVDDGCLAKTSYYQLGFESVDSDLQFCVGDSILAIDSFMGEIVDRCPIIEIDQQ